MRQTLICATCASITLWTASGALAATKYAKVGGLTTGDCNTWVNACTMDRALTMAAVGDSVWAKKTVEGSPYEPVALKEGVKLIGGFAGTETQASQSNPWTNITTIDGGGTQQCVFSEANSSSTLLRGFHINNCYTGDSFGMGGGMVLTDSNVVVVNCVFENNRAVRYGAAVGSEGTGSPKFFNCVFRNNGSGTAGSAQDNNVQPLAGGAVYLNGGSPSFVNCLFHGNRAAEGAVIAILNGTPIFTNCTIANNYCKYAYGGGLNDAGATAILRNCILWGNTAIKGGNQIFNGVSDVTATTYSDVQAGWTGTGNISSEPLFVDVAANDYKLRDTTPCDNVGSGTMPADLGDLDWDMNTSEPVPLDLAGGARVNVVIDMGAYEIQAGGPIIIE